MKWQTKFTDFADFIEVEHDLGDGAEFKRHRSGQFENGVNSFEVLQMGQGKKSGSITVSYMGADKNIMKHRWDFAVVG